MILTVLNPLMIHDLNSFLLADRDALQWFQFIRNNQAFLQILEVVLFEFRVHLSTHQLG